MIKIKIKLFATLREGRGKVIDLEGSEGICITELLDDLKIDQNDVAILLINGRDGKMTTRLNNNDLVSIFPPVGGG